MGVKTNIGWCDSTVNGTSGCDGCPLWVPGEGGPCYAGNLHESRLAKALPALYAADFAEVRLIPGRIPASAAWADLAGRPRPDKPWLDRMPRMIFIGDMGDLLSKDVPFEFIKEQVVDTALSPKGSRHIYMILTKRPGRLLRFWEWLRDEARVEWPRNLWVGASVLDQSGVAGLAYLDRIPAPVAFASCEPLRESVDLRPWLESDAHEPGRRWVIVGGESHQPCHPTRPFQLDWARQILGACKAAGTPAFVKQIGDAPRFNEADRRSGATEIRQGKAGEDWTRWPEDIRVRRVPRFNPKGWPL